MKYFLTFAALPLAPFASLHSKWWLDGVSLHLSAD